MKKSIIIIASLLVVFFTSHNTLQAQTMVKGESVATLGIGLGAWTTAFTTSETPLIIAGYETGIKDNFGPGNLSVGGNIAYKSGNYSFWDSKWSYTYVAVVGRASWHPHFLQSDTWDVYTGLSLGYYFIGTGSSTTDLDDGGIGVGGLEFATHVGARYNFSENWGAFAELGFGLGVIKVGAAYKF